MVPPPYPLTLTSPTPPPSAYPPLQGVCQGFEFIYLHELGGSEAIMGLCLLAMTCAGAWVVDTNRSHLVETQSDACSGKG